MRNGSINPKAVFSRGDGVPAVYQLFRNVLPSCRGDFQRSAVATWQQFHKNLYSRLTGIELLHTMLEHTSYQWLPGCSELPVVGASLEQIYHEISRHKRAVVKSPWSSSGRGLLLFPNADLKKKNDEVLSGMLNQQEFVTVEPWVDKVMDLSYQFYSSEGKINYKGRTIFETDQKGRYIRNFLADDSNTSVEVSLFLEEHNQEVVSMLLSSLSKSGYTRFYEGWIGVDALIYRSVEGVLKFHPLIEINGRFTMGAIALKMRERLAAGSRGFMQIFYSKSSNFQVFCQKTGNRKAVDYGGSEDCSWFPAIDTTFTGASLWSLR